jgi:hypothetical protein
LPVFRNIYINTRYKDNQITSVWADDAARDIVNLIKRRVRACIETMKIVSALPVVQLPIVNKAGETINAKTLNE